jgi:hypothetical protein
MTVMIVEAGRIANDLSEIGHLPSGQQTLWARLMYSPKIGLGPAITMVACRVLLACSARKAFGVEDQRVVAFRLDPATVGESAERLVC